MNHPNLTPFHLLQAHMSTPVAAINNPRIYVTVVMAVREAMCGAGIAGHAGFAEDVLRGIAGSLQPSNGAGNATPRRPPSCATPDARHRCSPEGARRYRLRARRRPARA